MPCSLRFKRAFIAACLAVVAVGCGGGQEYPDSVAGILEAASKNRVELEKTLEHYRQRGDSLKLQAALFLIGNMDGHSYVTYRFADSSDSTVELDATRYPDYETLLAAVDSIERGRGEIDYERLEESLDLETITADFLITQIDLAFTAWRNKPWAQSLTFDQFCRYVLPYRGSNESLEEWRSYFLNKYADIANDLTDPTDPVQAASLINDDIRSWFKFDPRYYFHPTDQGISEMLQSGLGRCEDMTNITIYALRANGIAVTSDYTPYWANTANNHAWNAIVTSDGRVIPFMGAEANPGEYSLHNKAAKLYRKTFDRQLDNLIFQPRKQDSIPRWLAGKNYIDVTADYGDVCTVTVRFSADIPDSVDIAYLCVFNDGEFKPIHWGRIEDKQTVFTDMGSEIVYLPATYQNERVVPLGAPFILHSDGSTTELIPYHDRATTVALISAPDRARATLTEDIPIVPLTDGREYDLFYWSDSWQLHATVTAGSEPLIVHDLPFGGLYWLVAKGAKNQERIFTVENGVQIFW